MDEHLYILTGGGESRLVVILDAPADDVALLCLKRQESEDLIVIGDEEIAEATLLMFRAWVRWMYCRVDNWMQRMNKSL